MKLSICTISFRHGLQSMEQLVEWAAAHDFDGIELWGTHARHLATNPTYNGAWLRSYGISMPMLSDYLPLSEDWDTLKSAASRSLSLASRWETNHIRIFAGEQGSLRTSKEERVYLVGQLHRLCQLADAKGKSILLETHPNTLCDSMPSTLMLLAEVNHPALHINFDVLHVWESGADVDAAYRQLQPFIRHMHLKNITSPAHLDVFAPQNVYAASGSRVGMTGIFKGCFDYQAFFKANDFDNVHASLEWFGHHPFEVLKEDARKMALFRKQKLYH